MWQQSLLKDLGYQLAERVWSDSSAALGICQRQGLSKLRHIHTQGLWVQSKVRDGSIELWEVRGDVNPAEFVAKHVHPRERVDQLVKILAANLQGRSETAPRIRSADGDLPDGDLHDDGDEIQTAVATADPAKGEYDGVDLEVPEAGLHDPHAPPHSTVMPNLNDCVPIQSQMTFPMMA